MMIYSGFLVKTHLPKRSLRINSYEIFNKLYKTNPIFPSFSPKNNDSTKKQTQFKPNSKPIQTQFKANSNPIASKAKNDASSVFTKN